MPLHVYIETIDSSKASHPGYHVKKSSPTKLFFAGVPNTSRATRAIMHGLHSWDGYSRRNHLKVLTEYFGDTVRVLYDPDHLSVDSIADKIEEIAASSCIHKPSLEQN